VWRWGHRQGQQAGIVRVGAAGCVSVDGAALRQPGGRRSAPRAASCWAVLQSAEGRRASLHESAL
jgi:hypothetical protein